jgi:hypothetical protein
MTQRHAKWAAFLLLTLVPVARIDAARIEGPVQGPPLPAEMLSDARLREKLIDIVPTDSFEEREVRGEYEGLLTEVVRRGGPEWQTFLSVQLPRERVARAAREEARRNAQEKAVTGRRHAPPANAWEIELLTALRRVQNKADPVVVKIRPDLLGNVKCVFPALPAFPVVLVNQDWDKLSVNLTAGGDYRSGRQARWRFDVRDEQGRRMPVRERFGDGILGGIYTEDALPFGGTWDTKLEMSSFVPALPPGQYTVRVLYHNTLCISEMWDLDGLVISQSPPITLVVAPATVELTDAKRREVLKLLGEIDDRAFLRIVAGTYGNWAYEMVPPDSAQGRILSSGLPAVPVLLFALGEKDLTTPRRAIILTLLFSLTGQNDPTEEEGVVFSFKKLDGPWAVWGGGAGGMGFGGTSFGGSIIDENVQREFAKRWEPWNRYVRVERPATVD